MLKSFLKSAFRSLWKNKTFGALNIFGLAIGIACAGLIFLWVEDERSFDSGNTKKDQLYSVMVNTGIAGQIYTIGSTPRAMAAAIKAEIPGIVRTARISDGPVNFLFRIGDKPLYAAGRYADPALFDMLTLPFKEGNAQTAFAQLFSLVLTEKAAKKFFGRDTHITGRTVRVNNEQDYTVTGILKDLPENASLQFEWLVPYEINVRRESNPLAWNSYGPLTYVELAPGADPAAIDRSLFNFIPRKDPSQTTHTFLFSMNSWRLHDRFENGRPTGGGRIEYVHMLSWIAWIILLIACVNFMNLSTARSQQRAREIGVRKVLGAAKKNLVARFMLDALLLSSLATVLSLAIMALTLPAFNTLVGKNLSMGLGLPGHWVALLAIILICGLVAGSYPSLYLSSFNPIGVLKGLKIKSGNAAWIRKALVVLQFSVSIIFIVATITVYRQLQYVKDRDLGFTKDRLIEIDFQHDIGDFQALRQDLLQTGYVEDAASSDHTTLGGGNTRDGFDWQGRPPGTAPNVAVRNVSATFVSTTGLHLSEGRDFAENEPLNSPNVLITESMAKLMGEGSAIGKILRLPANEEKTLINHFTVAGVVKDYVYGNMYEAPGPVVFFCKIPPGPYHGHLLYVRTKARSNPGQALAKIEAVLKRNNPAYPFKSLFVDEQFNALFLNEMLMGALAKIFAVLAIFISCLGLFGLSAYMAEQRNREMGIRKVLGAGTAGIAALLSRDFLQLVALSCLLAFPIAGWMIHDWLKSYEYRIGISAWIFLAAGGSAILIAGITVSFQAIRTALANPVKTLRTE